LIYDDIFIQLQPDWILIKCYISVSYQVTGYRLPCMFYDHYDQSNKCPCRYQSHS